MFALSQKEAWGGGMQIGSKMDGPDTLTVLVTYRCNAACEECCFESNPRVEGRLTLGEIKKLH